MVAPLVELRRAGITVEVVDGRLRAGPRSRLTDDLRALLRDNKTMLVRALGKKQQDDPRHRVLATLDADPVLNYAAEVIDPDADPVRVVIAVRGAGICELLIAGDKFDPIKFLEMVETANQ